MNFDFNLRRFLLATLTQITICLPIIAQNNFTPNTIGFNGTAEAIASDGTHTYVGGTFDFVTHNVAGKTGRGGRIDKNTGQPLSSSYIGRFINGALSGNVNTAVSDGNGGWFIGGIFNTVGGLSRTNIVHLLSDGSVDPDWASVDFSGINIEVRALVLVDDGLYVGGRFAEVNGTARTHLARLHAVTGNLDISWEVNLTSAFGLHAMVSDGTNLYIGGDFTQVSGTNISYVAKMDLAGDLDNSWNPFAGGVVNALHLDGFYLYIGGNFANLGIVTRNGIGRVDVVISTPDAWNPSPDINAINVIASDDSGIYFGGQFTTINEGGVNRNLIAKVDKATGAADAGWDARIMGTEVSAILVDGSEVYIGGDFTQTGTTSRHHLAKLNATDAAVDANWISDRDGQVKAIASDGADELYVGGDFSLVGNPRSGLVRYLNTTGALDQNWLPEGVNGGNVYALEIIDNTTLIIGGEFMGIGAVGRTNLGAINLNSASGDEVLAWNPRPNSDIADLAFDASYIYAGGYFTDFSGEASGMRNYLGRFDVSDFTLDNWNPDPDGEINSIVVENDEVFVAGFFEYLNSGSVEQPRIAKVNINDGIVDPTWNPVVDFDVYDMAVSASGLYAVGVGGMVQLDVQTGAANAAWDYTANGIVHEVAVYGQMVYLAGAFTIIDGNAKDYIARFDIADGTLDTDWELNATLDIYELEIIDDALHLGGEVNIINDEFHPKYAVYPFTRLEVSSSNQTFSSGDAYDFGEIEDFEPKKVTFQISNRGNVNLDLNAPLGISGNQASYFSIDYDFATITAGASESLIITFSPKESGLSEAELILDFQGSKPVNFRLDLMGFAKSPRIIVLQNDTLIAHQAQFNFGDVALLDQSNKITFVIENDGNAPLLLTGDPIISVTGDHPSDYIVNASNLSSSIDGAGASNFSIQFEPSLSAVRNAQIVIASNDSANDPYVISLTGTGVKLDQTITFNPLPPKTEEDAPFDVVVSATSELPVTLSSSNEKVATVAGNTITIHGSGQTEVKASQAGDDNYNPAPDVVQVLVVEAITAIEEIAKSSSVVYPNPGTGIFHLQKEDDSEVTVSVYNLIGDQVFVKKNVDKDQFTIDLTHLEKGVYIIQLESLSRVYAPFRLVKME